MIYKIRILENAQEDLDWLRKNDKASYLKCFDLVREIMNNPLSGTGKPERLRYFIRHEQQGQRFRYNSLSESLANGGKAFCNRLLHPLSVRRKMNTKEECWALKDIDFEIQQSGR